MMPPAAVSGPLGIRVPVDGVLGKPRRTARLISRNRLGGGPQIKYTSQKFRAWRKSHGHAAARLGAVPQRSYFNSEPASGRVCGRLRTGEEISVAFRSAKVALRSYQASRLSLRGCERIVGCVQRTTASCDWCVARTLHLVQARLADSILSQALRESSAAFAPGQGDHATVIDSAILRRPKSLAGFEFHHSVHSAGWATRQGWEQSGFTGHWQLESSGHSLRPDLEAPATEQGWAGVNRVATGAPVCHAWWLDRTRCTRWAAGEWAPDRPRSSRNSAQKPPSSWGCWSGDGSGSAPGL